MARPEATLDIEAGDRFRAVCRLESGVLTRSGAREMPRSPATQGQPRWISLAHHEDRRPLRDQLLGRLTDALDGHLVIIESGSAGIVDGLGEHGSHPAGDP